MRVGGEGSRWGHSIGLAILEPYTKTTTADLPTSTTFLICLNNTSLIIQFITLQLYSFIHEGSHPGPLKLSRVSLRNQTQPFYLYSCMSGQLIFAVRHHFSFTPSSFHPFRSNQNEASRLPRLCWLRCFHNIQITATVSQCGPHSQLNRKGHNGADAKNSISAIRS